jgi:glycosyltransferase involved in cell wall biosynthesis
VRILVDARKLTHGGIGRYIENLATGLVLYGQGFLKSNLSLSLILDESHHIPSMLESYIKTRQIVVFKIPYAGYSLYDWATLRYKLDFSSFDVFHCPQYPLPRGINIPSVVTIHDLIHLSSYVSFATRFLARRYLQDTCKRASAIISVSNFTKESIISNFSKIALLSEKVSLIPNSLKHSTHNNYSKDLIPKDKIYLNPGFLLGVFSNNKPHKGLFRLLRSYKIACDLCAQSSLPQPFLVLVGSEELLAKDTHNNKIISLGHIDDSILEDLYRKALGLIVCSDIEGFCLPVLEAHSVKTPCILTPIDALLELATEHDEVAESNSEIHISNSIFNFLKKTFNGVIYDKARVACSFNLEKYELKSVTQQVINTYCKAVMR